MTTSRNERRKHRTRRIRAKINGTAVRPRISVFRSLTNISAQMIDDVTGQTLCTASLSDLAKKDQKNTSEGAAAVGKVLAKKCVAKKIQKAVFDRGGYHYHGKIKALADGVRDGGITM